MPQWQVEARNAVGEAIALMQQDRHDDAAAVLQHALLRLNETGTDKPRQ